ncbi:organomercurial lyase MerB [Streptomyces sp. TRM68367]|uniref:organomercurial lyase MerB n=1 Tax=Streptomyces sp. TRM68367 TaxID=2758415 RepID=UPI00165AF59E|nr:organomercurial lyase MerB [Streptomyces sp. TRM68367]MBC9723784.1 organomercurial lyase MerB [Streptomyces sp. TRM68367]
MDTDTQKIATRFTDTVNRAPGVKLWLLRPLLTLLATGEPVTLDQLAAQAGRPVDAIREALADMPDTEYDTQGRIIGNGLTHNPTPHRYEANNHTLYAWCAMDTLVFPAIIGHTAQVASPCRATGEPVRLTVTPDGPTNVEPATAVVSVVTPDAPTSVRAAFCNQVHFFASADAAKDWLAEHRDAQVLPVADAHTVGRPIIEQILSGGGTKTDCC